VRKYERTRIEGATYFSAFLQTVPYIRKYISKSDGSADLKAYFARQDSLLDALNNSDEGGNGTEAAFIGDIMWVSYGWDRFLDPPVLAILENHDLVFGNLETPVDPGKRVTFPIPDHPAYNSPVELLTSFTSAKTQKNVLTAVSMANNHVFDRGTSGALATMKVLDSLGILYSGVTGTEKMNKTYALIERDGIRFGFYGTCWGTNQENKGIRAQGHEGIRVNKIPGLAPLVPERIDISAVQEALHRMEQDSVDVKIVSVHWGFEFEQYPDPAIMETGHAIAAAGADLVIGSHPHVIQPHEVIFFNGQDGVSRKRLIAYSLGNFCTPMYTPGNRTGEILSVSFFRNPATGRVDWKVPETYRIYNENGRKWRTFRRVTIM
jgi:poly-gamma-glutamate synthesis protein (capsule biosynthesis protein)